MKKILLGTALVGVIGVPITYSAIATSQTKDYSHHSKAENYHKINAKEFIKTADSVLHLRYKDYRANAMANIVGGDLTPHVGKLEKNNYGELRILPNQPIKITNQSGSTFTNQTVKADVLQNDIFSIALIGNYTKVFSIHEAKALFTTFMENLLTSRSLQRCQGIRLSFNEDKDARAVSGNMIDDIITLSINVNDRPEKIIDRIYYVTFHELMHLEESESSFRGNLLGEALEETGDIARMKKYGELTNRPELVKLAQKLHDNLFIGPVINNVYLGNIENSGYKTLSGEFESEITHLYTKPEESIVEDLLSISIGRNYSNQYNSKITGLLGSIGYRVSHNVSLLNIKKRELINMKLLSTLADGMSFKKPGSPSLDLNSEVYVSKDLNRTKIGFYTNTPAKLHNKVKVTLDGKEYQTDLKQYKTNMFMRTAPFGNEVISYHTYYQQITIPNTDDFTNISFEYVQSTSDEKLQNISNALTGSIYVGKTAVVNSTFTVS